MRQNMLTTRTIAATVVLASLTLQGDLGAQVPGASTGPQSNLQLGESSGEPRGYAFLMPVQPHGRVQQVNLQLKPESTVPQVEDWIWKVDDSPAAMKTALTFKWYAQASCPDNLTLLQVSGPGGTLTQNPLINPIWGYFSTQSFTIGYRHEHLYGLGQLGQVRSSRARVSAARDLRPRRRRSPGDACGPPAPEGLVQQRPAA